MSAVDKRLDAEPGLASDPAAAGPAGVTAEAAPDALFVSRVERRVRVYPGAVGYAAQAKAMDGYDRRVAERDAAVAAARPALEEARAKADAVLKGRFADRDAAQDAERALWNRWHKLAERIGLQAEIERRIAVLKAEIRDLDAENSWWAGYAGRLEAARGGPGPVQPGQPDSLFWLWLMLLFLLAALLAAWWGWWGRHHGPRPVRP
jgi:hypothetical protein